MVIPTYNAARNITTVLARVLAAAPAVDVLVVDHTSPDGTAGLVTAHPAHRTATGTQDGAADDADPVFLLARTALRITTSFHTFME